MYFIKFIEIEYLPIIKNILFSSVFLKVFPMDKSKAYD